MKIYPSETDLGFVGGARTEVNSGDGGGFSGKLRLRRRLGKTPAMRGRSDLARGAGSRRREEAARRGAGSGLLAPDLAEGDDGEPDVALGGGGRRWRR